MKKNIFTWLLVLEFMNLSAQSETNKSDIIKVFEKYCPIYILNNYCNSKGLTEILKSANTDERVYGINTDNENRQKNPEIAIKYEKSVIVFEKGPKESLGIFKIYFENNEDVENFTFYYSYLMGFIPDTENPRRFYFKNGQMNAVIKNSIPERNTFYAVCFVFQPDFCN